MDNSKDLFRKFAHVMLEKRRKNEMHDQSQIKRNQEMTSENRF